MQAWEVRELYRNVHFQARTGLWGPCSVVCGTVHSKPGQHLPHRSRVLSLRGDRARGHGPSACCSVRHSLAHRRAPVFSCLKLSSSTEISTLVRSGGRADDQCPPVKHISDSPLLASPRNAFCAFTSPGGPPTEAPALSPLPTCAASRPRPAGHASKRACPADASLPADSTPTGTCGSHGTEQSGTDPLGQADPLPREFGCGNKRIKQLTTGSNSRRSHGVGLGPPQVTAG